MARNIAKRFATMTLIYWAPIHTGSGLKHESPVEFKGFYIGNAMIGGGGISDFIASGSGRNDNFVLFYLLEPDVNGYVTWKHKLSVLEQDGLSELPPSEIAHTHKIKSVTRLTMLRSKESTLENMAFIASVE